MNQLWKLPFILMFTTLIAAAALALVNNTTKPIIEKHKRETLMAALSNVSPAGEKGKIEPVLTPDGQVDYYKCYAESDSTKPVGYIFTAFGVGYSSTVETLVGVDTARTIFGINILSQQETPGLGAKVTEIKYGDAKPWFQTQFAGKKMNQLAVDKDGGAIESVTGATISSRAVTNSIHKALEELVKKIDRSQNKVKPVI